MTLDSISESEFSTSVSEEKLSRPSERLYGLSQYLLANRLIEGFQVISNAMLHTSTLIIVFLSDLQIVFQRVMLFSYQTI